MAAITNTRSFPVCGHRSALQAHEFTPGESQTLLLSVPKELRPSVEGHRFEPLVANIEADDHEGITARARALEFFLRDSGQFSYTLQMDVVDRRIDPVEDFLVNRKRGHCGSTSPVHWLFCSVPLTFRARLVNGFKGGDWNELTETMNVRQKHAHSWVEAFVGLEALTKALYSDYPGPDARRGTHGVDRSCRRYCRQLPPGHRRDPPYLGVLHRRI